MKNYIDFKELSLTEKEKYCMEKKLPLEYEGDLTLWTYHQTLFKDGKVYFCGIYETTNNEELFLIFSPERFSNDWDLILVDSIKREEGENEKYYRYSGSYSNNIKNAGYKYINSTCLDDHYFSGIEYDILKDLKKEVAALFTDFNILSEHIDYPPPDTSYGLTIEVTNFTLAVYPINNVMNISYIVTIYGNKFCISNTDDDIYSEGWTLTEALDNFLYLKSYKHNK